MIDAKGDLIAGTAADAAARLAVGANDTLLVADSAQTTGMKWSDTVAAKQGAVTASGITQTAARLLGRTTASTGAIEEISVAASLTLSAGSLSGTQASTSQAGVSEWATQAEADAATASRVATTDLNSIALGTPAASTSGTTVDFTGIPAGTRRITMTLAGVSTNGTSNLQVQIGDSGGIENTGYLSNAGGATNAAVVGVAAAAVATGFYICATGAADVWHGQVVLTLVDAATFTWVASGIVISSGSAVAYWSGGSKSTSAILDRVRLTTVNGTDAFDAGKVNIAYER